MIKKRAIQISGIHLSISNDSNATSEEDKPLEFMTLDDAVNELIEDFDNEVRNRIFTEKDKYDLFENCAKNINEMFFKKFNFSKDGNVMFFDAVPIEIEGDSDDKYEEAHLTNKYSFLIFGRDIENLIFRNLEFYTKNKDGKLKAVFEPNYILMKHLLRNGIMDLKVSSVKDRRHSTDNEVSSEETFVISFIDARYFNEYNKRTYWLLKDEVEYKLSNGYYEN